MDASEKCTPDFERLLYEAGLSEREAEALRTVAQGLTAEEAGQLMGVTPSTVGTYRQRGYKKLGVSTRSEFLSIPQARAEAASAARNADAANTANNTLAPDCSSAAISHSRKNACATRKIVLATLACLALSLIALLLLPAHSFEDKGYLDSPSGTISTDYGDLPNVVGMRADAAASEVAQAGFCPLFEAQTSELPSGKVLEIKNVKSAAGLGAGVSAFSWGEGCTSGYNLKGGWKASVVLVVAT